VLDIDPLAFARASFERAGTYERGPFELVYGAGSGEVQYRFVSPAIQPQRLQIAARISSELPGHGVDTDARDGSDVQVLLDDIPLGVWRAPPDDGLGEVLSLDITDPALLVRIFRRRHHRLTLRALPSQHAGGLCIYGRPSGHFAIPPALRREVDSVRITLSEAAPSAKQR
jgi:predicted transcriptional regulator